MKAEDFCKELGIYPIDSKELVLDNTANKTQLKKINLCDLLETYAKQKAIEFRMWDYYKIGMDINELRKTCVEQFEEYERP